MPPKIALFATLFLLLLACNGCQREKRHYTIGVSQCSDDEWRHKMNNEILQEALFYEGVDIEILTAEDNNEKQIQDISYFIQKSVDLLVVAPNEAVSITPIVEQAYDCGIPVIIVDRKILSDKYTAFIGADNYEIGKEIGNYAANYLKGKGNIIEITGLSGSTPAIDRHAGFIHALKRHAGIHILAKLDAGWLQERAMAMMDSLLYNPDVPRIDLVFAQNDRMGIGAYKAAKRHGREKGTAFIGIDALPGKGYGVDLVLNGILTATFIYPTGGDRIVQTAMDILQGKPFSKENILTTAIVDKTNARIMKLQTDHIAEQESKTEALSRQIDEYSNRYASQQIMLYASFITLFLLSVLSVVTYATYRSKKRKNLELSKRNKEIMEQKDQLERQRDQLITLSKQLEEATHAKLTFFTNVSHDFRTPLTLITAPTEQLLADGSNLTKGQRELLEIIHRNVLILLRLINQILDFRKYENGKLTLHPTTCNLKEQIEEWNKAFQPSCLKKHIKFSFMAKADDSFVATVDVEKFECIYFNLLSNAFKFTPENGKINVSLSASAQEGKPSIRLEIADNGIGIPQEHIGNIFDRFYKIDSHHTGSGIGLALVKAFVEMHEGKVEVESQTGKGTKFTIEMPAGRPAKDNAAIALPDNGKKRYILPEAPHEASQKDETESNEQEESILVIDDNPDIRNYIRNLFQNKYAILEAKDGKEGLLKAVKYIPDIILCDIMMPVMDGIECCKRLKQEVQTSHIPVVLLTACSLDEQRIEGFRNGADSYISKPFNYKVLEARIRNLLDGRKQMRQAFGSNLPPGKDAISSIDKDFITRFHKLVEKDLADPELNVEDLGRDMGMSRVQLYRKIKSLTNYGPNELIRIARLKKAASLLGSTDMTVAEITYEVGFSSPSYFTKCYKEYFGETPGDFLKRKK